MGVIAFIFAYLIGSISSSFIIGKLIYKIDLREAGSGNLGATNALRNFGKKVGAITLLFDALKGFIACLIGEKLGSYAGSLLAMLGVIIGHMYPFYLKFQGGKGIATGLGVLLYQDPLMALVLLVLFVITVVISKYVSLGSIVAAISASIYAFIFYFENQPEFFWLVLIMIALIIYKHRTNVGRILKGKESKLGAKVE